MPHRHLRVGDYPGQQMLKMPGHPCDGFIVKQRGIILPFPNKAVVCLNHKQRQVKLRNPALHRQDVRLDTRQRQRRHILLVAQIKHHLKERVIAQATLWLERFDHLFKGHVLVGIGRQRDIAHMRNQRAEGGRVAHR